MSDVETKPVPPAIWGHLERVYAGMKERALVHADGALVYTGFTSKLFQELGIAVPYYGRILSLLQKMGCITQERRGGGTSQSMWRLWKDPDLDAFMRVAPAPKTPRKERDALLRQQMEDLRRQLGGVDVPRALAALANRLGALEETFADHASLAFHEGADDEHVA